jgi:predicted Fe-Mo cluster-binding NifX family protein
MNKKIAIPVEDNGNLNTHFGHSSIFEIFTVEKNQIVSNQKLVPPPHTPGAIPKWLIENNVTNVIAGGIGEKATKILEHFGVNVHKGAAVRPSIELAEALLNNSLELSDENCRHDHHDHHEHQHGHHHHHSEESNEFEDFRLHLHHRHQHGEI